MQYLKQYGLQASGTNFSKYVLETNYDCHVHVHVGGNKHGYVRAKPDYVAVRDPYDWLASCYRKKACVIEPFREVHDHKMDLPFVEWYDQYGRGLLDHYCAMNSHWLSYEPVVVHLNASAISPESYFEDIATKLGLNRRRDFTLPECKMIQGWEQTWQTTRHFDIQILCNGGYLAHFDESSRNCVAKTVTKAGLADLILST